MGLKAKVDIVPQLKLKNFHWTKLANTAVVGTVWMEVNDESVSIDGSALETMFAKQTTSTCAAAASSPHSANAARRMIDKPAIVKLIDDKRSYTIDVGLARFKLSPQQIRAAVLAMDANVLQLSKLQTLRKCCPSEAEMESVRQYDGDVQLLSMCLLRKDVARCRCAYSHCLHRIH